MPALPNIASKPASLVPGFGPRRGVLQSGLLAALDELPWPLAVAYSGGSDSTALLVACAQRWPGQVMAVHVNHGLQAAAVQFEAHCRAFCGALGLELAVLNVNAHPKPGESPENAARDARYAAFSHFVQYPRHFIAIKSIVLAQHADDQLETLLLALSRGAGLPGLAAMAGQFERAGVQYHRPWLAAPQADIKAWLLEQGAWLAQKDWTHQPWIDDPTNADPQFTRNRIRAQVLPALIAAFPQARATFARASAHAAQAQRLLSELAACDLASTGLPPKLKALQTLSPDRQANALRHWLKHEHQTQASAAQMAELLSQIARATTRGQRIHIKVGHGFVHRSGADLQCLAWYNP